ncbi:MAG TPA: hypothetical protein DEP66_00585 [Acidimicrobiaceae bacterium]|nr:hypothetical protein [Acidimicrobiaceae bacterium]HCB36743.1 hypothetical protein [Acidimicrobiaceae bacterium]
MANSHGCLPKVSELDDRLRARLETWYDKAYADDNLFRTLANDDTTMQLFLDWVAAAYAGDADGRLDRHMLELCRIRMANRNECFH